MSDVRPAFVVASDLEVDPVDSGELEEAFRDRLWRDHRTEGAYLMVTWWDDESSFRSCMRSRAHKVSHARIPTEPAKARGVALRRFTVVTE